MSKYKIGDIVRIRSDLETGEYETLTCHPLMVKHAGETAQVTLVGAASSGSSRYKLSCLNDYYWSDDLIYKIDEEATKELQEWCQGESGESK